MMKAVLMTGVFGVIALFAPSAFGVSADEQAASDVQRILRLHQELIEAHKSRDVEKLLAVEAEEIVTVGRGEVLFKTKKERVPQFTHYLETTEFAEYRDLIDPIVRVSKDGTLGWLIAQVKIVGTRSGAKGKKIKTDSVWAWIELYEKKEGRWYRVGEVSNVRPDDS